MRKFALLIGVSESSEEDLPELPSATEDIRAMQAVLQNPEMGGFDSVAVLPNPTRQEMEEAIETLFANCKKEDLVLFYFSGHGIIDEKGKFYLVTPQTRKERGNLIKATAVAATVLHDNMGNSRSKHQVLILDSCFSGAIAEGLTGKSAESKVDIQRELGGEGRAILTSSNAVQKSFHIQGYNLSIYTHYLTDGIQTGAANQDGDDYISVDELHEYAKKKLEQEAPLMSPQFFPVKEGYKIRLVRSPKPKGDPRTEYRKEAERLATAAEFTIPAKRILMAFHAELELSDAETEAIEAEVLKPFQEYQRKRQDYKETLRQCLHEEATLSPNVIKDLMNFRNHLGLKLEDVAAIEHAALNGHDLEGYVAELERQRQAQAQQQVEAQRKRQKQAEAERQKREDEAEHKRQAEAADQRQREEAERQKQATAHQPQLDRDDLKKIVDYLAEEFKRNKGIDLRKDRQALQRLTAAAEKVKIELSSMPQAEINLPFIIATEDGPEHLDVTLTRVKFEELCSNLIDLSSERFGANYYAKLRDLLVQESGS